jgi:hypothetical protein
MPRRHYRSVEELRGAVAVAMERLREQLGQGVLQSLCIGTYLAGDPAPNEVVDQRQRSYLANEVYPGYQAPVGPGHKMFP